MKYKIQYSTKFKKDLKLAKKRGLDLEELKFVIDELAKGNKLDDKYKDHDLHGDWEGYRECHIEPDWLLVYQLYNDEVILYLVRTGMHSDLFNSIIL